MAFKNSNDIVQDSLFALSANSRILVRQSFEVAEWLGFETRNKYRISDETGREIGFVAEQQKGLFGFLLRQFLGHFRSFEMHFFSPDRKLIAVARHPFRWYFKRLELRSPEGAFIGALQKRFSVLSKSFDVENSYGQVVLSVSSPFWRIWTFKFERQGRVVGAVRKKWSGVFTEWLTDKDSFLIEFLDENLDSSERDLILVSSVFIDLSYFEKKAD